MAKRPRTRSDNQPKSNTDSSDTDARSLGDEQTHDGHGRFSSGGLRSLGDEATAGISTHSNQSIADNSAEVIDLSSRYEIVHALGRGGMGEVLLVQDKRLGRRVALKRILGDAANNRMAVNRFLSEAKAIAALNHPNIIHIYDYGQAKDGPYLTMEYVEGGNLLEKCRSGAIALEETIELIGQICDGLGRAHKSGIIHRDIKPANILITPDGRAKLTDFGLAKDDSADAGMTMTGAVLGTLDFMPPEQRRDASKADRRSDLWSLAATLYQMLTGKSPKVIRLNDLPPSLQEVLGKALEEHPNDRYQTASELKEALRNAARSTDTEPVGGALVDLSDGQCLSCGTRNDLNRKFCRNCTEPLRITCLGCKQEIPVWDDVCGECGVRQSVTAQELEHSRTDTKKIQELLSQYEYSDALWVADNCAREEHRRLDSIRKWGESQVVHIESQRKADLEMCNELIDEALKHGAAHDYPAAIQTLERIPKALQDILQENPGLIELKGRTQTISNVPSLLEFFSGEHDKQQSCSQLEQQIKQKIEAKQTTDLLPLVEKLLKLSPDRQDVAKLKKDLNTQLHCSKLEQQIKQKLMVRQLGNLLPDVNELLNLQPDRQDLIKLKEDLIERENKMGPIRNEAVQKARELISKHDFRAALTELGRVDEFTTQEVLKLQRLANSALDQISKLRRSIAESLKAKNYNGLKTKVDEYLQLMPHDKEAVSLKQRLIASEQDAQRIFQRARELVASENFEEAKLTIYAIPPYLRNRDTYDLADTIDTVLRRAQQYRASKRSSARKRRTEFRQALAEHDASFTLLAAAIVWAIVNFYWATVLLDGNFFGVFVICGLLLLLTWGALFLLVKLVRLMCATPRHFRTGACEDDRNLVNSEFEFDPDEFDPDEFRLR